MKPCMKLHRLKFMYSKWEQGPGWQSEITRVKGQGPGVEGHFSKGRINKPTYSCNFKVVEETQGKANFRLINSKGEGRASVVYASMLT